MSCALHHHQQDFLSESRGFKLGKRDGVYSLVNRRPMCWVCDRTTVTCRELEDPFWMETTRSEEFVSSEEFEAIAQKTCCGATISPMRSQPRQRPGLLGIMGVPY